MEIKELIIESPKYGRHIVLYDAADAKKIEPYNWCLDVRNNTSYAKRTPPRIKGTKRRSPVSMHNELMSPIPEGHVVDHRNRNGLDNRKENLRVVTRSQNLMNRGKTRQNTTGYKGAYNCGDSKLNPYTAKIEKDRIVYHLGHHKTAEEAARAYDKKAVELHGAFAVLNFPKDKT